MGNLLRVLYKSDENYTEKVDIFVDFESEFIACFLLFRFYYFMQVLNA